MKIGDKVYIKAPHHPWHGNSGRIVSLDAPTIMRPKSMVRIKLENGQEVYSTPDYLVAL